MRARLGIFVASLLAAAGCAGDESRLTAPRPETHFAFDVTSSHAFACDTCHGRFATFTHFDCVGCHTHEETVTARLHTTVDDYAYDDEACYGCHRPGVVRPAYDHAGISGDCATCHAAGTPFAALASDDTLHVQTGGADCSACHATSGWRDVHGAPAGLVSDPARAVTVDTQVPRLAGTSVVGLDGARVTLDMAMDHAATEVPGCSGCHPGLARGSLYPGVFHASLTALGLAQPSTCAGCHAGSAPAGFVGPAATLPVRVPSSGEMRHEAVAWLGGAPTTTALVTPDCGVCHAAPTGSTTWTLGPDGSMPATFHAALDRAGLGQPTSCLDCHANTRPPGVTTTSGRLYDHETDGGSGDCVECHAASAPGFTSWMGGRFHAPVSAPTSCLPCHEGARPTSTEGWTSPTYARSPFDYGTNVLGLTHGAGGDCAMCHPAPDPSASETWAGGSYGHDAAGPAGTTCVACHTTQRPDLQPWTTPAQMAALLGFDHATSGTADCFACHQATVAAGAYVDYGKPPSLTELPGGDWRGGLDVPTTPVHDPAHDLTLSPLVPIWAGSSIASFVTTAQVLPMPMSHASPEVPAAAACVTCHPGADSGVYAGGDFHASLIASDLAPPVTCESCHDESTPDGFVGPTATNPARTPSSGEMDHGALAWSAGGPTSAPLVTADCGVCHASPTKALAATWATAPDGATPARFHAALAGAALPQPASCLGCHANSRPTVMMSAPAAALPAGVTFDHATAEGAGDCASCHATSFSSWATGRYHPAGGATPATCLPCHAGERPSSTTGWLSTTFSQSPFDYVTNGLGLTHGAGQDCALCHRGPGTGAWGGSQNWVGGSYSHDPATIAGTTCIPCHTTQRPDLQSWTTPAQMTALLGFDHAASGAGDCFGCHQATVTAGSYVHYGKPPSLTELPGGDWRGGVAYPGATLVGSPLVYVTVDEGSLQRVGSLVSGINWVTANLYEQMNHEAAAIPTALRPAPPAGNCAPCHAGPYGQFHAVLTTAGLSQPTTACAECHSSMRPPGIVAPGRSSLQPMDHSAVFDAPVVLGGALVHGAAEIDCSSCHVYSAGGWQGGVFHAAIGTAAPADCVACHYPLMADAALADVTFLSEYSMRHRSTQLSFQSCERCHSTALAAATQLPLAATLWTGGGMHQRITSQPTACNECHGITRPGEATQSLVVYALSQGAGGGNGSQWMNHGSAAAVGTDCALCHQADARSSGGAWSKEAAFHVHVSTPSTCADCHGPANLRGTVAGENNNMPVGVIDASTLTTASANPSTGIPAGTHDRISHDDINVMSHDCDFCHTQVGASAVPGIAGKEWAQASFHRSFGSSTPLVMNGETGRCSTCHINVKPGATYTTFDHTLIVDSPGTMDCSACHTWPGTGTSTSPNWQGGVAQPIVLAPRLPR